eukprot:359836-Chlamydomonas_euryale.AAC.1
MASRSPWREWIMVCHPFLCATNSWGVLLIRVPAWLMVLCAMIVIWLQALWKLLRPDKPCDKACGASEGQACDTSEGQACNASEGQACGASEGQACDTSEGQACDTSEGQACGASEGQAHDVPEGGRGT